MNRSTFFKTIGTVSVLVAAIAVLTSAGAEPRKNLQDTIRHDGKLKGGTAYWSQVKAHYGKDKKTVPAIHLATKKVTRSQLETVGDQPEGFGKSFTWDRQDDGIVLAVFVNAADPFGVSISGVQDGDKVQVTSAAGIASFTEDKGNPLASSLVGLIATGVEVFVPEATPLVDAAESFAKDQFKATGAKHKRRDAFGVDPSTAHKALQEGGVLICLPGDGGPVYSGNGDHKERWLKKHEDRADAIRPDHLKYGFFLQREPYKNVRTVRGNGEIYVLAWDHKFEDNAGYYKVFVHLTKGKPASSGGSIPKRK
jgi:hypothetical protein